MYYHLIDIYIFAARYWNLECKLNDVHGIYGPTS